MNSLFVVCDTELSGPDTSKHDIIAVSMIVSDYETFDVWGKFTANAKPRDFNQWNDYAENIHGITKEACEKFQDQKSLLFHMAHFLHPFLVLNEFNPLWFISHSNNNVDYRFVQNLFKINDKQDSFNKVFSSNKIKSSVFMFAEYLKVKKNTKGLNLKDYAAHFGLTLDHHDVESDTIVCFEGVKRMLKDGIKLC